jgi:hypothetical protein
MASALAFAMASALAFAMAKAMAFVWQSAGKTLAEEKRT